MSSRKFHKDICVGFPLGGRTFEAVGFLADWEESVQGEEALRRADNGELIRSEEDWQFVHEHRGEFPRLLEVYCLATARPEPQDCINRVSVFRYDDVMWCSSSRSIFLQQWDRQMLILRRVVS